MDLACRRSAFRPSQYRSMVMVNQEWSPAFVSVTCSKCGKGLRAKVEQVGTEIRCWDCHQMVVVPFPRQGHKVAIHLYESALDSIKGPETNSLVAGAAAVTAILTIPTYGVWCSTLALMLGASAYGEIIRRASRGPEGEPESGWLGVLVPNSIPKVLLCFALAVGTVWPLWIKNAGLHRSPHWDGLGRVIAASTWIIVPLLMALLYGRIGQESHLANRQSLKSLTRHRYATLLALAVVPLALALTETILASILYASGNLPFYSVDYMPRLSAIDNPQVYQGIAFFGSIDFRNIPDSVLISGYFDGLVRGRSFVAAIPASLSLPSRMGLSTEAVGTRELIYVLTRLFITMCVVTCLLAAFAIQARWLGTILALENRRPA